MHFMSQPRYNPRTQRDDWYYRIKESFRDLTGRVRSRIMLNVGFIDEPHRPEDIRDIGKCLTYLHEHHGQEELFGNPLSRYNEFVQRKARDFGYPSISKYYVIDYIADNPKNIADIQWRIAVPENVDKQSGIYFLRTNVSTFDEKTTWDYYNLTREIECTNRQLDGDCPEAIHAEGSHHGSHQRPWREGPHEALQRAEQIGG